MCIRERCNHGYSHPHVNAALPQTSSQQGAQQLAMQKKPLAAHCWGRRTAEVLPGLSSALQVTMPSPEAPVIPWLFVDRLRITSNPNLFPY